MVIGIPLNCSWTVERQLSDSPLNCLVETRIDSRQRDVIGSGPVGKSPPGMELLWFTGWPAIESVYLEQLCPELDGHLVSSRGRMTVIVACLVD